jgi:V8-like Glu-specific endopeptidase
MTLSVRSFLGGFFRQLSRPTAPRRVLRLEALEDRAVPAYLTPINVNATPYSAICLVQSTFPNGQVTYGTAVMVDSFHALTAGHVVYDGQFGGWAKSIEVIPDDQGNYAPYGTAYMTYERTFTTWVNYSNAHPGGTASGDLDIGMITLNTTIGSKSGYMLYGYNNNNSTFASGDYFGTAGYPGYNSKLGFSGTQMYLGVGPIAGLSSDTSAIDYTQSNLSTYSGDSGSPVWNTVNNVVYGIHVGGTGTATSTNFATRITQSLFNTFQSWEKSDPVPSSLSLTGSSAAHVSLHVGASGWTGNLQDAVPELSPPITITADTSRLPDNVALAGTTDGGARETFFADTSAAMTSPAFAAFGKIKDESSSLSEPSGPSEVQQPTTACQDEVWSHLDLADQSMVSFNPATGA